MEKYPLHRIKANALCQPPHIANGNFQGYTTAAGAPIIIYDPATGDANGFGKTPFPNNTIPSGRIAPQSTALLKYLGTSTNPYYSQGQVISNYSLLALEQPQNRQGLAVRGDYNQSAKSQLAFRYSSGKEDILTTGLLGAGEQDHHQLLPVLGITHLDHFAPHCQRSTIRL